MLRAETPAAVLKAREAWPRKPRNQYTAGEPWVRLLGMLAFDDTDCWYFRGSHTNLGYGVLHALGEKRAHRVSWVIANGPIPAGMHVLHKCDVRCCVNPDHLFLGTHADNMRDMTAKSRNRFVPLPGELNPASKLTAKVVRQIRDEYARGEVSQSALAKAHGVSVITVNRAINRKTWVNND